MTKKFRIISNVSSLFPSQWKNYEKLKKDLRGFGFIINDETDEIEDPKEPIELTWDDLIEIEKSFSVFVEYDRMTIEFRLK